MEEASLPDMRVGALLCFTEKVSKERIHFVPRNQVIPPRLGVGVAVFGNILSARQIERGEFPSFIRSRKSL